MFEARRLSSKIFLQALLFVLTVPFLLPLIQMVMGSLRGAGFGNYKAVWNTGVVPTFFRNSAIVAVCSIALVYCVTMTAAFGFAKLRIAGKEIYFWMLLAALTLPEVVLLAPLFATTMKLGVHNTLVAVILPLAALQAPFTILLARNFYEGVPSELLEAGRIDGAGVVQIFWHIVLPLTRPIAAAIIVLTLINAWNSYLLPLVMLISPENQVVTLLPQFFVSEFANDQTKVLASAVITAIPEVLAYLLLQKYFERGLAAGALK
ncbi:MAG: carbohydrate ABC transporter permease [Bifidobacteriaceae bacterium]|jgi:raffinose/stachyose/melibiose transport system permease protein|nr:carbohydrate ABC transporter permease [Bifidobacteriaceae bacterium]